MKRMFRSWGTSRCRTLVEVAAALAVTVVMAVTVSCTTSPESQSPIASGQSGGDEEPLLLLDDTPAPDVEEDSGADNTRCFVCHISYAKEKISRRHARAGIGCADCHGESDAHIDDESWATGGSGTPPEKMYRRDQVNGFCTKCHEQKSLKGDLHQALFDGSSERVCTDCHGSHRLAHRVCQWK